MRDSVYVLSYWVNWEDSDQPRTINMTTRIYSPAATGNSIDLMFDWHFRARSTWLESFTS